MYIYLYTYKYIYIFKYIFPNTYTFTGMSAMAACERSKVLVIATNQGDISVWSINSTLESAKKALPPISAPLMAPTKCAKFKAHSESISCLLYITERRLIVTVLGVFHVYLFCFSCAKFKAHSESISCLLYITERRLIVTVLGVFHVYFRVYLFCFSWLRRLHHLSMDHHT